jgi:hypothetical protein
MDIMPNLSEIDSIVSTLFPYVHSTHDMKYFTNHARDHSIAVLKYIDEIIAICDLSGINLNEVEKSILKCSCFLHDLGCIYDRDNHAEESVKIIDILCKKKHIDLKVIEDEVKIVVQTHSSKGLSKLESVDLERKIPGYDNAIRLKLLCVLFNIADECHIDRFRAPEAVYDVLKAKMPVESKSVWKGHQNLVRVYFSFDQKKIIVKMKKRGDPKIVSSLKKTMKDKKIRDILRKYKFPCMTLDVR